MIRLLLLALLCGSCAHAQSNPTCGHLNDKNINVAAHYASSSEAHDDGSQLGPPSNIGGTITDSTYGCTIKRLTKSAITPGNGHFCNHEYANMSAVNENDTLALISCNGFFIIDMSGNIVVPIGQIHTGGSEGGRWDPTNPYVFYYWNSGGTPNALLKATIPANTAGCAPACNPTIVTLHTFSEYSTIDLGGGEGDMFSPDHLVLDGTRTSNGSTDIFIYTISTDTKGPVYNFTQSFDNIQITGSNQMVVNWGSSHNQFPYGSCVSGPCLTGFELFGAPCNGVGCSPANASYVSHLFDVATHSGETRDNSGNDLLVTFDVSPIVCANSGVVTVEISTAVATCIVNFMPWDGDAHVTGTKNLTGNNWIFVSGEDGSGFGVPYAGAASYPLNANWNLPTNSQNFPTASGQWGLYTNDSYVVNPSGSSVYRLYQSRSRPGGSDYWKQSRASISRDGAYIIFDSDFGLGQNYDSVTDYIDVYEVATGITNSSADLEPAAPLPPSNLKAVVN